MRTPRTIEPHAAAWSDLQPKNGSHCASRSAHAIRGVCAIEKRSSFAERHTSVLWILLYERRDPVLVTHTVCAATQTVVIESYQALGLLSKLWKPISH